MKIPIDTILVPPDRQRKDFSHVERIADSFRTVGQITPILVTRNGSNHWTLIAGECRLRAARLVPWTEIEAYDRENLTDLQRKELEWEENSPLTRRNLTWQESCVSLAELHFLKQMTHGFGIPRVNDPSAWTREKMAAFSGYSTGRVSDMLNVAEVLKREPRDAELWACTSWKDAAGLLVLRNGKLVEDEMNRRRALANPPVIATDQPASPTDSPSEPVAEGGVPVQTQRVVYIHGNREAFDQTKIESGTIHCIVGFFFDTLEGRIFTAKGGGVVWGRNGGVLPPDLEDCLLVWNKVTTVEGIFPYDTNYVFGVVYASPTFDFHTTRPGVISCIQDDPNKIPFPVLDYSISPFVADNMAVHCLDGVDPLDVLELGRVPIWYEPDPEKYAATCARIKEWYENHIPNVEVRVK